MLLREKKRFGNVVDGEMCLNELGDIADKTLLETEEFYKGVHVLEHVIMPDHMHFIVNIEPDTTQTLALVVGEYKSMVSKRCLEFCKEHNVIMGRLWQSGFYEHVVCDAEDYEAIRAYICNNPKNWAAQGKQ